MQARMCNKSKRCNATVLRSRFAGPRSTTAMRSNDMPAPKPKPEGLDGLPIGECTKDPERWTTAADDDAKVICRACARRWACARDAVELPRAEGLWAGIVVPEG